MFSPIRVFILDSHDEVRRALADRLSSTAGIQVVGQAAGIEDGWTQIQRLKPDVVLIEPKRTGGRGLELVGQIARSPMGVRVIVLTSYPSEWERWAAQRAGATSYLLKDLGSPQLINQIRDAVDMNSEH